MEEVYKNLSSILIEDPIIKVDEFQGIFTVDCRSDLFKRLLMTKQYEPELVKCSLQYLNKKRDVIDVGANIGFYTVLFAKNLEGKSVLSIEPTVNSLRRLYKNIQLNKVENNVIVFEGAVSNKSGITEIKTIDGKEEYSTLGGWEHPAITNTRYILQKVKLETIDELVIRYSLDPGFMKVDVEGMEHLVFEGAKMVLNKYRPIILTELSNPLLKSNGSSSIEIVNFIKSHDYNIRDVEHPGFLPEEIDFTNIICIPKEISAKK
jgi:FkbM family methyltransferase